ncbi:o-succinylbenzoate--CoA ligase [Halobacillus mangrovi]|uniref:2-succinylbenzoate--CoA ligase n=1 Tax=Halobacillus mangrovi TaxID=402384 RepID=A0A1W5ZTW2_9BACI|nr:o-succinylbenzoate--CoA ligase [Halobacillus mangrovi]ARI76729.1 o-succinylbenzoate--CoA ligase [Halobacillus mangrovi]
MNETIPHWLEKQNELNPEHVAIEQPDGFSMSFSKLRNESRNLAENLITLGVKEGDHVALLMHNQIEFPVFIHSLSYIGATAVLLNTRLTAAEIAFPLSDADVSWFFAGEGLLEKAEQARQASQVIPEGRLLKVDDIPIRKAETLDLKKEIHLDQVFTMMYTSGTTGNPKAVMHTYGNHWFSAVASALNLGVQPEDKWLLCLPMFHVGGFSVLMKSVIYGITVSLIERFDAPVINREIRNNRITHISVVTLMLQRLLEDLKDDFYPNTFRCMLLGGGPVPETLLRKAELKSVPVFQTYGMTETSSQIATLNPSAAMKKLGSAGKALTPAEVIVEADGPNEVGEILVKGPMVSKGYYNHTPLNKEYLRTGDLGYKDDEGFLYVVDRVKDVIISGGENIYPAELESVLSDFPGVKEAGVTGISDETWGEVPAAFLVPEEGVTIHSEDVAEFCEERLAKYKIPKAFFILAQLPRNASNKLLRRELFSALEKEN